MPSKSDILTEIIRLYDENAYLKRELQVARDGSAMSGLQKFMCLQGHNSIAEKLFKGWYFQNYAPKVAARLDEDAPWTIVPFQTWLSAVRPDMIRPEDLFEVLCTGTISFESLKVEFEEELKAIYESKVQEFYEAHNETV